MGGLEISIVGNVTHGHPFACPVILCEELAKRRVSREARTCADFHNLAALNPRKNKAAISATVALSAGEFEPNLVNVAPATEERIPKSVIVGHGMVPPRAKVPCICDALR
jgi:hypothetical protein